MFGWLKRMLGNSTDVNPLSVSTEVKPLVKTPEEIARIKAHNLRLLREVHVRMITEGKLPRPA